MRSMEETPFRGVRPSRAERIGQPLSLAALLIRGPLTPNCSAILAIGTLVSTYKCRTSAHAVLSNMPQRKVQMLPGVYSEPPALGSVTRNCRVIHGTYRMTVTLSMDI